MKTSHQFCRMPRIPTLSFWLKLRVVEQQIVTASLFIRCNASQLKRNAPIVDITDLTNGTCSSEPTCCHALHALPERSPLTTLALDTTSLLPGEIFCWFVATHTIHMLIPHNTLDSFGLLQS